MENVGALTFRGLDAVLGSLSEIGYNAEWQDIRASDMGAPHRRERIWIVAYSELYTNRTNGGAEREKSGISGEHRTAGCSRMFSGTGSSKEILADSNGQRCEELHITEKSERQRFDCRETVKDSGCEHGEKGMQKPGGLRGQQKEWDTRNKFKRSSTTRIWDETVESRITRMDDGVSRKLDADRLRGLGNAIVPQIAELLFNQIKELL